MDYRYFSYRRDRLAELLQDNSLVLLYSGCESNRNGDSNFAFRVDSSFWYLTGLSEPDSWLVVWKKNLKVETSLYVHPKNAQTERWEGRRLGLEGAVNLATDRVAPCKELAKDLSEQLKGMESAWLLFHQLKAVEMLKPFIGVHNRREVYPDQLKNLGSIVYQMRWIKDEYELKQLRDAANINSLAHIQCMRQCQVGKYEYQLEAAHRYESMQHGAIFQAYNPIVAGGENACVLHYTNNNMQLSDGDMVLVDAGCEYNYYASDITRSFPVNGRFSTIQLEIYQLVLLAQQNAIDKCRSNSTLAATHQAAHSTMTKGLLDMGILDGKIEDCISSDAIKPYFMHRTSHWMGLDVHDPSHYSIANKPIPLEPGAMLTVEPGLYFDNHPDVPEHLRGLGIRIEDDILITQDEPEVLTIGAPKLPEDMCAIIDCEKGRKLGHKTIAR